MIIVSELTALANDAYKKFQNTPTNEYDLCKEKIKIGSFVVFLISPSLAVEETNFNWKSSLLYDQVKTLHKAWHGLTTGKVKNQSEHMQYWNKIDEIGKKITFSNSNKEFALLRRFASQAEGNYYFLFLTGKEPFGLPLFEINYLCDLWQVEQKKLLLHSAGIIHNGGLYLFGGPSKAGKSTVSMISKNQGNSVLDEDKLILSLDKCKDFQAQAWGYSLKSSNVPIRAVFNLVKDVQDQLVPLSKPFLTRYLFERSMEAMGSLLERKQIEQTFQKSAYVSRQIPGYELHFRKGPDFWKIIDKEISFE